MHSEPKSEPDLSWDAPEALEAGALIERALAEDLPAGDLTSDFLFPAGSDEAPAPGVLPGMGVVARCVAREAGVFCGAPVVEALFAELEDEVRVSVLASEGSKVAQGDVLLELSGPAAAVLRAERVLLNFLQRLCGIASWTARWVEELEGIEVVLLDTRKTTPGWRRLEKYAVRSGGGTNHRFDLSDAVMIKDNHSWIMRRSGGTTVADWVSALRAASPGAFLQVEVDSREEYLEALEVDAIDSILLDNFPPGELAWAVEEKRRRESTALLEASGGIGLGNVRQVAETGVDRISVGALTHSAVALDVSLELSELFNLEQKK